MDENQKKLIEDQMNRIPAEVREAIRASDWERTIFNIGREHKMHIDDIDTLSVETILTMIGLEHPKDYPENIQKRIGLKDEELMNIVDQVNERLFSKIREALKTHYEKVASGEIMDDEEKDALHYSGIEVEDGYTPKSEKKTIETFIDKRIKAPEPVIEKTPEPEPLPKEVPVSVPAMMAKEGVIKIPEIKFDPYREPIE